MLDSSKMDRLITIQTRTVTRSASGQEIVTWTDLATIWAEKIERGGREFLAASQVVAELDAIFKIRYRDGLNPLMRVICAQQTYNIRVVQEIGRREGWMLLTQIVRLPE
jgi:SPP1 family predicted phage head-tail adaptor